MKEHFTYFAKLSLKILLTFIKINLLGFISTVLVIIIEFSILSTQGNGAPTNSFSFIPDFVYNFWHRPIGTFLWLLTCLTSTVTFFIVGNNYIISKVTHQILTDKSESLVYPFLDKIFLRFKNNSPHVFKNIGDYSVDKIRVIQSVQEDQNENKWLRRIIAFAMKRVKLDDVDFKNKNQDFYEIFKAKTIQNLKEISEPSKTPIWIILAIQWLILIFIWKTNY